MRRLQQWPPSTPSSAALMCTLSLSGSGTAWQYSIPEPTAPEPETTKPPRPSRVPAATAPPPSPLLHASAGTTGVVDPLLRAAFEADVAALAQLLTGDPAGVRNRDGESLLHVAATSPSPDAPEAIALLVARGKVPIDGRDTLGRTPLHTLAARAGHYARSREGQARAVLAALLGHGADINAPEPQHGRTPLHLAVAAGNLALAQALLVHGADPSRRDGNKRTPLALGRRLVRECGDGVAADFGPRGPGAVAAAMVQLLLAHAAGDSIGEEGGANGGEREEGDKDEGWEEESPLRFVRGAGARGE